MKKIVLPEQQWLEMRREGLGASEAPTILGINPYQTPLQLYHEKRGLIHSDEVAERQDRLELGLLLQPVIYQWTQRHVVPLAPITTAPGEMELVISDQYEWLRCTPDAWAYVDEGPSPVPAEFKTAAWYAASSWLDEEQPPLHYVVQVQHQLLVTERDLGYLVALIGGETFRWTIIRRDEGFLRHYLERATEFWQRVQAGDPPLAVGADKGLLNALRQQMGARESVAVELPPEFYELRDRDEALAEQIRALTAERDDLEARVRQYLVEHGATVGLLRDGRRYEYVIQSRAGYTVGPSTFAVLRRKGAAKGGR
ncbi:MAG: YqaJ viral recombinase family protein [Armatimonadota bacterium]|nr:YqaJ viral recombinase family protein [Armatimonadota bacterium]